MSCRYRLQPAYCRGDRRPNLIAEVDIVLMSRLIAPPGAGRGDQICPILLVDYWDGRGRGRLGDVRDSPTGLGRGIEKAH